MEAATNKRRAGRTTRDPQKTREAIMEVAGKLLAKDGPEGLSVSQVAQLAGVNRGTAYHHFPTREQLLDETKAWVSDKLRQQVFGDATGDNELEERREPRQIIERLANFAMDNPEFGRVWLYEVLRTGQPADDPFWRIYKQHIDKFVGSDYSQPGIDADVHAITLLVTVFMWPVWARNTVNSAAGRKRMAQRFTDEMLRMSLYGSLNKDKFPDLDKLKDLQGDASDTQPE